MSGRQSAAVAAAIRMVRKGHTVTDAATKHSVALSSVRRGLRAEGVAPLPRGRRQSGPSPA